MRLSFRAEMQGFSNAPLIQRLMGASVKIAEKAGGIIRSILNEGQLGVVEKGLNDYQTRADLAAQHCIIGSLYSQFPDRKFKILAEENYTPDDLKSADLETGYSDEVLQQKFPSLLGNVSEEEVTIWVDPVDGTAEFSQSLNKPELREHVTVLIGFAIGSEAVAGVIHQPFYNREPGVGPGRTVWGVQGLGCFGVMGNHLPDGHIITTTRSHSSPVVDAAIEALKPTNVLRIGGAGYKVLMIIEGKAHAYVFASPGCKKWDTCAPEAVLRSLGGNLSDIHGNRILYHAGVPFPNSAGVLATPKGVDHQFYVNHIPMELKSSML